MSPRETYPIGFLDPKLFVRIIHAKLSRITARHLYEDVWSMDEAISFLASKGFSLAQIRPIVFGHDKVSAIEFDCVFRRLIYPLHLSLSDMNRLA